MADVTPPKAELEDLGQALLPGMEDVDFLPPEFVLRERLSELPKEPSPLPEPSLPFLFEAEPVQPPQREISPAVQPPEIITRQWRPETEREIAPVRTPLTGPELADYGAPKDRPLRAPAGPLPDFLTSPGGIQKRIAGAERKRQARADKFLSSGPKGVSPMEEIPSWMFQETGPPEGTVEVPRLDQILRDVQERIDPPSAVSRDELEEFLQTSGVIQQAREAGIPEDEIRSVAQSIARSGEGDFIVKMEDFVGGVVDDASKAPDYQARFPVAWNERKGVLPQNRSAYYDDNALLGAASNDQDVITRLREGDVLRKKGMYEGGDAGEIETGLIGRGWGELAERSPEVRRADSLRAARGGRSVDQVRRLQKGQKAGLLIPPGREDVPLEGEIRLAADQQAVPFEIGESVELRGELAPGQVQQLSRLTGADENLLRTLGALAEWKPEEGAARVLLPKESGYDALRVRNTAQLRGQSDSWWKRAYEVAGRDNIKALQERLLKIPERFRWIKGMPTGDWYGRGKFANELPVAFDRNTREVFSIQPGGKIVRRQVTQERINSLERLSEAPRPGGGGRHPADVESMVDVPVASAPGRTGEAPSQILNRLDKARQPRATVPSGLLSLVRAVTSKLPLDTPSADAARRVKETFARLSRPQQQKLGKEIVKFAIEGRGRNPYEESGKEILSEAGILQEIIDQAIGQQQPIDPKTANFKASLENADFAVVFTGRSAGKSLDGTLQRGEPRRPSRYLVEKAQEKGVPILENPTPEELSEIISTYGLRNVHVISEKNPKSGIGPQTRANAVIQAVLKGGVIGGAALGMVGLSEDDAEASTPSALLQASRQLSRQRRLAQDVAEQAGPSLWSRQGALDQFAPLYDAAGEAGKRLEEVLSTIVGGGMGKAASAAEPMRFALQSLPPGATFDDLERYLSLQQARRLGEEVLPRKASRLHDEMMIAIAEGRREDVTRIDAELTELQKRIDEGAYYWQAPDGTMLDAAAARGELSNFPPGMERAAHHVYQAVRNARQIMQEEGLLDPDSALLWDSYGGDYIPNWREVPKSGTDFGLPRVRLDLREERVIDSISGSLETPKSPFHNALDFIENAVREASVNRGTKETISALQEGAPETIKALGGRPLSGKIPPGWSQIAFLENGKPQYYLVPEHLGQVMQLVDVSVLQQMKQFLRPLTAFQHIMQRAATTANYAFGLAQPFLDVPTALWQTEGLHLRDVPTFMKHWTKAVKDGMMREIAGAQSSPERQRALNAGALYTSISSYGDFREESLGVTGEHLSRAKDFLGAIPQAEDFGTKVSLGAQGAGEVMEAGLGHLRRKVLQPFEEATKIATHETLLGKGVDPTTAAFQTRTYGGSPDFARRGASSGFELMKTFIPFLQPTITGIDASIRGPMQDPKKAIIGAATLAGIIAMQEEWNSRIGGESWEQDFTDYDNDASFIILHPTEKEVLSNGIERPAAIKIPLAHAFRPITNPIRALWKGRFSEAPLELVDEMLPIGSAPIEGDNIMGSLAGRVGGALNPLVKVPMEQFANEQFFTRTPIVNQALQHQPAEEQFDQRTHPLMVQAGRAFNLSPKRLEHAYRGFLPGAGQLPLDLLRPIMDEPIANPPAQATSEQLGSLPIAGPILRRFLPQAYSEGFGEMQGDFYDAANLSRAAKGAYLSGKELSPEQLEAASASPMFGRMSRSLGELNRARRQILSSPEMGPEEKREALRQIQSSQEEILRQFLTSGVVDSLYGRD